jgi:hypothetical protein
VGGVFICYRRDDTAEITGRLYDRLAGRIGKKNVFKDVFSIELGRDFDEVISAALRKTSVLLVAMGATWDVARLQNEKDPVRREIELALALGVRIVPLFVRGMKMPKEEQLPASLQAFVRLNGMPLRDDPDFDHDIDRLLSAVAPTRGRSVVRIVLPIVAMLAVVGGGALWLAGRGGSGDAVMPPTTRKLVARHYASPFCWVDSEESRIQMCTFSTIEACTFVLKRGRDKGSQCVPRPASIYCKKPDSTASADVYGSPCFTSKEACGAGCVRVDLDPPKYAATPYQPITDDELATHLSRIEGTDCMVLTSAQKLVSCSGSLEECQRRMPSSHSCSPRPPRISCVPSPLASDGERTLDCYLTAEACRKEAMPGTTCRDVDLIPPAVVEEKVPAAPPPDPRVRVTATMPRHDLELLKGGHCIELPDMSWKSTALSFADLQSACFATAADCVADLPNNRAGARCTTTRGFWCYVTFNRWEDGNVKPEPSYCGANKADCEGTRKGALGRVITKPGALGRVGVGDRCLWMPLAL